jgi:hypothetical protein
MTTRDFFPEATETIGSEKKEAGSQVPTLIRALLFKNFLRFIMCQPFFFFFEINRHFFAGQELLCFPQYRQRDQNL